MNKPVGSHSRTRNNVSMPNEDQGFKQSYWQVLELMQNIFKTFSSIPKVFWRCSEVSQTFPDVFWMIPEVF